MPILDGAGDLARNYDAWLCDIWCVVHNGRDAFPEAHKALSAFREAGGTVILITNAPAPGQKSFRSSTTTEFPRTPTMAL